MKKVPSAIWAGLILGLFYFFFRWGIAPLAGALTGTPAPLPSSLYMMYSGMTALAILLFLSLQEDRWNNFVRPVAQFLTNTGQPGPVKRTIRITLLVAAPILAAWRTYSKESAVPEPPGDPPGIHFSLPSKYVDMENPLPWTPENIKEGGILYTSNCAMCHGDAQDGDGLFARSLQPRPANFRDSGTIAQLDVNYLFWRIKEGGPGIPRGAIGYRSAMPIWDGVLSANQIWKIIMFQYTSVGQQPAKR